MSTPKEAIDDLHQAKLYRYFYEDSLSPERTIAECDFILIKCELSPPASILEKG